MRVAYYSPLPPSRSGIADYSTLLLPELRKHLDIVVVKQGGKRTRADASVYHIGNNPDEHGWIWDALQREPGVVVLHEVVLHHLIAGVTLGRGSGAGYLAAMERELGIVGRLIAHGVLDNSLPILWETRPQDFPLVTPVLDRATAVIVHSRYAAERVRAAGYDGRVWTIPHPAWPMGKVEPAPDVDGDPLVGCFGFLNASKRIPQLLEAFAQLLRTHPRARLLLVGQPAERFDLTRRLERLGLAGSDSIRIEGYANEERLWSLMTACDVCVNLRFPTMGETSGSVLRALSLGRPLVVSDLGWFSELPGDVALKVPVDEWETETLAAALALLAERPDVREAMTRAARQYVSEVHDLARVAARYAEAIEVAAGGDAVRDAVLRDVARSAAEVGLPDVGQVGRRLADIGLE